MLRKAGPPPGQYRVGDIISFQRERDARTEEERWQHGARIVGFEGKKTAWCIVDGTPVCVSTERMRPCTPAEALAYHELQKQYLRTPKHAQQSYVDYRRSQRPDLIKRADPAD